MEFYQIFPVRFQQFPGRVAVSTARQVFQRRAAAFSAGTSGHTSMARRNCRSSRPRSLRCEGHAEPVVIIVLAVIVTVLLIRSSSFFFFSVSSSSSSSSSSSTSSSSSPSSLVFKLATLGSPPSLRQLKTKLYVLLPGNGTRAISKNDALIVPVEHGDFVCCHGCCILLQPMGQKPCYSAVWSRKHSWYDIVVLDSKENVRKCERSQSWMWKR